MSFLHELEKYESFDFAEYFESVTSEDVEKSIGKEKPGVYDILNMLSPAAEMYIEQMAERSHSLTLQYFGGTISLYIPLYISNYCSNGCIYCGFSSINRIPRKMLTLDEIETEAMSIKKTGIKHLLVLTGEAEDRAGFEYVKPAIELLSKHFPSISVEMFPMSTEQYADLKKTGVDGLTVYQEVYDRTIYKQVHPSGKKSDYKWRIDCPERGAKAGLRLVNIGALYGLGDVRTEAFLNALHAKYLDDKYPDTEIAVSFPRITHSEGNFKPKYKLSDRTFVQFLTAFRIFLPRVGLNVSTRENAEFRDNLLPLGITRMSAGSKTSVGGYAEPEKSDIPQFDISDNRNVLDIISVIKQKGFQPVLKDWELIK